MKVVLAGIGILTGILCLTWVFQGNDFFMYRVFAPGYEQTRRQVFEQSKAYNQGMLQELENMQLEYLKASPEGKDAMASIILHRASEYGEAKLPSDLRIFIADLKQKSGKER